MIRVALLLALVGLAAVAGLDFALRGKNAIAEALLGSTAAEVIRGVESPCLVVKRKGAGIGILREMLDLLRT